MGRPHVLPRRRLGPGEVSTAGIVDPEDERHLGLLARLPRIRRKVGVVLVRPVLQEWHSRRVVSERGSAAACAGFPSLRHADSLRRSSCGRGFDRTSVDDGGSRIWDCDLQSAPRHAETFRTAPSECNPAPDPASADQVVLTRRRKDGGVGERARHGVVRRARFPLSRGRGRPSTSAARGRSMPAARPRRTPRRCRRLQQSGGCDPAHGAPASRSSTGAAAQIPC